MLRRPVVRFVLVLVGVYAAWFAVYQLWLLPSGVVDAWLSEFVASAGGAVLGLLGMSVEHSGRVVRLVGHSGVIVVDGCNGLEALGLFVGFVLAYPGAWVRRAWFLPLGLVLVVLANVLRVAGLAALQAYWPAAFAFFHDVAVTVFFYLVIFGLWIAWAHVAERGARRSAADATDQRVPSWSA